MLKDLFRVFGLLTFVGLIVVMWQSRKSPTGNITSATSPPPPMTKDDLLRAFQQKKADNLTLVYLRRSDLVLDRRINVATGSFTINNNVGLPIKDIAIRCDFLGGSETVVTSRKTIVYDLFKAKETKKSKVLNLGFVSEQAARYRCGVEDFEYAGEAIPR